MISGETLYPDLRSHLFSFLNRRFFVRFFFNVGKVYLVIPRTVGSFRESGLVRLRDKQLKTSWPNPHTILLYLLIRRQINSQFCLPWVWFWNDTHNRLHNLPCIYSNLYCDEERRKKKKRLRLESMFHVEKQSLMELASLLLSSILHSAALWRFLWAVSWAHRLESHLSLHMPSLNAEVSYISMLLCSVEVSKLHVCLVRTRTNVTDLSACFIYSFIQETPFYQSQD